MNATQLNEQFVELLQQIDSFLGLEKTVMQKQKLFGEHRDGVLAQIPQMGEMIDGYPFYGAVGFIGKFHFVNASELKTLKDGTSKEKLYALVGKGHMQIAENAKPAWDFLLNNHPESLCVILALCFMADKNAKVQEILGKSTQRKPKHTQHAT